MLLVEIVVFMYDDDFEEWFLLKFEDLLDKVKV